MNDFICQCNNYLRRKIWYALHCFQDAIIREQFTGREIDGPMVVNTTANVWMTWQVVTDAQRGKGIWSHGHYGKIRKREKLVGSFCGKVFTFVQVFIFLTIFLCRCQKFPNLPNYCVLVQDPNDQCCGVPYCGNPNNPTPLASIPPQYQTMPPTTPIYVNPNQPSPISGSNTPSPPNGQYC